MKLIRLSAVEQPSFKTIEFNRTGITLILGYVSKSTDTRPARSTENDKSEETGNGVGKTLALGLVHHCLGANAPKKLKEKLSEWTFRLDFELNGQAHVVERSVEGSDILLNNKKITLTAYRNWLNACGAFDLSTPPQENLSFRSLFTRFARHLKMDCLDPLKTHKEPEVDAQLRTFFLLGLEYDLIISKRKLKKRSDDLKQSIKTWKTDPVLREIFRAGEEPKLRMEWLEKKITRLTSDLEQFEVAENYHALSLTEKEKTHQLRDIEKEIAIKEFQLDGIEKSLEQKPDISRLELLGLYEGLQQTFKPEILAHFDAVENFHNTFIANRKKRLEADRQQILRELEQQEKQRQEIGKARDELMKELQGKRALDEYTALSNQLMGYKTELDKIGEYLGFIEKRTEELHTLREQMVHEEAQAEEYVKTVPDIGEYNSIFSSIAARLYPKNPSGIVLANNDGTNQLRYTLTVQISGGSSSSGDSSSDGIDDGRILCFDWLLLMYGKNHHIDFLWHDNRLFANMGENPRAAWFKFVLEEMKHSDKQYIASINMENYESMKSELDELQIQELEKAIVLRLRDDDPKNKLLGIQFN